MISWQAQCSDTEAARNACRRGLIGLPLNEPIYCARMRVEAAAHNPAGIHDAYQDLMNGLNELNDPANHYEPSREAIRVYEGLTELRSSA